MVTRGRSLFLRGWKVGFGGLWVVAGCGPLLDVNGVCHGAVGDADVDACPTETCPASACGALTVYTCSGNFRETRVYCDGDRVVAVWEAVDDGTLCRETTDGAYEAWFGDDPGC